MKKLNVNWFFPAAALATTLITGSAAAWDDGDEWGCTCLLCLANPSGPKAVTECESPIDRLYDHLKKDGSMPGCPMAGEGNYATVVCDPYDPCRLLGLEDASVGWVAEGAVVGGRLVLGTAPAWNNGGDSGSDESVSSKACVNGGPVGTHRFEYGSDSEGHCSSATALVYGEVLWQARKGSRAIDVYMDGVLQGRVSL